VIVAWNVDLLFRRVRELEQVLADRWIDVAYVLETRWKRKGCRFLGLHLEQILVLILDHIRLTVDRLGTCLFLLVCTGPTVPVVSVGSMSPLMLACCYQVGSCSACWIQL